MDSERFIRSKKSQPVKDSIIRRNHKYEKIHIIREIVTVKRFIEDKKSRTPKDSSAGRSHRYKKILITKEIVSIKRFNGNKKSNHKKVLKQRRNYYEETYRKRKEPVTHFILLLNK